MTTEDILKRNHTVAVVGLSDNPERPSHIVAKYLKEHGYHIIPVNPQTREVLGEISYPDLLSIPQPVDVVDIFRRSEDVIPIVEQAIKIGARVVWMQEGVVNEKAASIAQQVGLIVVMDKCMKKEHEKMSQGATSH